MDKEEAEFIKDLRINKGYSWRAVHRDWKAKYLDIHDNFGHQMLGIELCDKAMKFLEESVEDGWN